MRILLVSDIHANWPALAAIDEPHDLCLCLGDLVDYGPDPALCVRWAIDHAHHAIRGNHDHGVAQDVTVIGESGYRYLTKVTRPGQWARLDPVERQYLLRLPLTLRLVIDGRRFLLVHGSPRDPLDEYLMGDPAHWESRLTGVDADFVCVGHTHMQFHFQVGGVQVVNPGSVGQPRDGDPRAGFAIIEDGQVELKRIEYDLEDAVRRIEAADLPDRARAMLIANVREGRIGTGS